MDIVAETYINHEFPEKTSVEKAALLNRLQNLDTTTPAEFLDEGFFSLYGTYAGFDPTSIEHQRMLALLNQGIASLPQEMLSLNSDSIIPLNEKVSRSAAFEIATRLCESNVIYLRNYARQGIDFLARFGQIMSPIRAISEKARRPITSEEFRHLGMKYFIFPLMPLEMFIGADKQIPQVSEGWKGWFKKLGISTNKDTQEEIPRVLDNWIGWLKKEEAPELYDLLVRKWSSLDNAWSSMREVGAYSPSPTDLEGKRKEFQILAGGTVQDLEDLAAAAPDGSNRTNLAGKFANLFNFDYSEYGLIHTSAHLLYGVEQNYVDFQQTVSPFVKHRNKVQVLDLIGYGKHSNFAGGKEQNGGILEDLLKDWGVTEQNILAAAVDIETAKRKEEPFTFTQLDQIIQKRGIPEDMAYILAFGFGLDNSVRKSINRLRLLSQPDAVTPTIRNNFKIKTGINIPDLSIVSTAELRVGKYWNYQYREGRHLLGSAFLSEIFES